MQRVDAQVYRLEVYMERKAADLLVQRDRKAAVPMPPVPMANMPFSLCTKLANPWRENREDMTPAT